MSVPLDIGLKDELLFIKSLLIPSFNPDNQLHTSKKRKEWLGTRGVQKKWNLDVLTTLIERYDTVTSLEEAERKSEEVEAERLLEKAEENERKSLDTAVLGELLIGMNEILKIIRPQKKVHRCQASAISTECRKQLLQIHKVAPTTWVLKDYGDPDKFQAVYNAVLEYTGVIYEHYVREELDEKAFVQPAVRDRLWPALRPILNCGLHFELENEREFLLRRANEGHYAEIDGLTDHCVKMMISDDRLLTLEDKSVLKKLEEADIAQAQSQLAYEVEGIGRPSIPQFVGILQNGCDWSFLSRQMDMGKERWEYVQLNPTFTEDGINHGAVHTVSRFLQHTLCIVDAIYAELILPRYRTVESIAESKTEDGSKDDEGSRDDRDGDDHPPPAGSDNRVHPRHQREDAEGPL